MILTREKPVGTIESGSGEQDRTGDIQLGNCFVPQ
jgi:hypothetical protein